jgi:hypothetical protein
MMDSYKGIIEKHCLVVTRAVNPYTDQMEWCVGRIYHDATLDPMSYGKTIEEALESAHNLIKDRDSK